MRTLFSIFLAMCIAVWSFATAAKDVAVDLELVLAVDVSGSIDEAEARLQREGYVNAILHPEVVAAVRGGMLRRVAVTYVEWAGLYQNTVVDWHLIVDERSAAAFAQKLIEAPIFTAAWTSISGAINYALPLFGKNGYSGVRQVIDLSGDGPNNEGEKMPTARDRAVAAGVTVNGLPIVNDRPSPFGFPAYKDLDLYYIACVIGGPGGFIVVADTHQDFARAIRKKLILETANRTPNPREILERSRVRNVADGRVAPACDNGEKRRELYWNEADDY